LLLNLVVIRSDNLERLVTFYRSLGLQFSKEKHGRGAEHYSCRSGELVFEIYPLRSTESSTGGVRLGFSVKCLETTIQTALAEGATLVSERVQSNQEKRAVIKDPDGHKLELVEILLSDCEN
jgi:lactoylglutathione lyase